VATRQLGLRTELITLIMVGLDVVAFFVGMVFGGVMHRFRQGGKNSATTVMPLLSAALYLGQFVSPIIVTPASHILFGSADLTGPYKVGIVLCLLFMVQVYLTRHFQSLPPK